MKITIQPEVKNKFTGEIEQAEVSLDDTSLDTLGFMELQVGDETITEIHINDLYPALVAFKQKYEQESK